MRTLVIAEIGVNHNNDLDTAKRLINAAKEAGADVAKFQHSNPDLEISRRLAPDHYEKIKAIVPTENFLRECADYCLATDIEFLCTPAEEQSLIQVMQFGPRRIKVSSDNLTNIPFLRAVRATGLPVILSTGMATAQEIWAALDLFPLGRVTLLHCISGYPTPRNEANLGVIRWMARTFPCPIGFSDHTQSTATGALAVAAGAVVVEKHITLDRNMDGPDHSSSLEPGAFKAYVDTILAAEVVMGSEVKEVQPSERLVMDTVRKSLVAAQDIEQGDEFMEQDIAVKRPGVGMSPLLYDRLIGCYASRSYKAGDLIDENVGRPS